MDNPEKKFKVIVIGDAGVGKTALTYRFCDGRYMNNLPVTVGIDLRVKKVKVDNEIITLQLWDTAGMERNRQSLSNHYYRNVHAVILVYDVSNQSSFDNLVKWINEIQTNCPQETIKILIGNKCDETQQVNRQKAQQFADAIGIPLFETSAKMDSECDNIEGIFLTVAHKLKTNDNLMVNSNALSMSLIQDHAEVTSSCSC